MSLKLWQSRITANWTVNKINWNRFDKNFPIWSKPKWMRPSTHRKVCTAYTTRALFFSCLTVRLPMWRGRAPLVSTVYYSARVLRSCSINMAGHVSARCGLQWCTVGVTVVEMWWSAFDIVTRYGGQSATWCGNSNQQLSRTIQAKCGPHYGGTTTIK